MLATPSESPISRSTRRLAKLSVMVPVFTAAIVILVWAAVVFILHAERENDLAAVVRQNRNLSRLFEEQVLRVLATTDQALMRLSQASSERRVLPGDLVQFASETGLTPGIMVQLSLIDATGRFVGSNIDPTGERSGPLDLSQREHVRIHLAPQGASGIPAPVDGLFIGKPVLGKVSGRWTMQISRAITSESGKPMGVVVASLDPAYFEDVFRRVDLAQAGSVSLVGADLTIRARVMGGAPQGMGSTLPASGQTAKAFSDSEGSYTTTSNLDNIERVIAFRKIARYPLFVVVAMGKEDALVSWRTSRNVMLSLTGLLTFAMAIAVAVFVAGVRRLERTNATLRISEAQAQSANRAKSEFLVAMSHELRTPLTSIRGFAELMELRLENPKFREQAGLIRKGAEYLNKLFTEILDLAKLDAGAMQLTSSRVEIRAFVREVCDFFKLSADAKQLELQLNVASTAPEFVHIDELRLKQILSNLLSNAIKFTPSGEVTLDVSMEEGALLFCVSDTGPGIAPDMHEAIFERFRQGDSRVSYEHGGTGLGLALSRAIAEIMGGRLVSAPGSHTGSRFVLSVPHV
jgi:signal transduction histidine kinase